MQTVRAHEILFLDNGSSDGSVDVAGALFDRFELHATIIRNTQTHSISANFNRMLAELSGDIVAPLSTDDWYEPGYVATLAAAASTDREAGWFSCRGWLFYDAEQCSEPVDETHFVTDRPVGDVILDGGEPHLFVGCAYRRAALESIGGWDEQLPIEDRDLFLRLSQRFSHRRMSQRLVHYRRTSKAASANAAFMLDGWEKFYAKHAALFGGRLRKRRAETFRSYAALLTDQRQFGEAYAALAKALRLRPGSADNWRTLAYLARRSIGR